MSKSRLEPMGDYLLATDARGTSAIDGIELPDNTRQQEMMFGIVVFIGPSVAVVKPKDRICYGPYAGKTVILDGLEFRLLREGQIEGKIVDVE